MHEGGQLGLAALGALQGGVPVVDRRQKAAGWSIISNTSLVGAKTAIGLVTGSVAIISEAIHSGMDLLAALIAFFSVRAAARPADAEHEYGHGKIENISGSLEAVLILVAAGWIIYEALPSFSGTRTLTAMGGGIAVMAGSSVVNWLVSAYLFRVARAEESVALEADALHLRTDVYTSLGVLAGLVLIYFTGYAFLDGVIAIGVALLIIKAAYDLLREAFLPLIDVRLSDAEEGAVREIIEQHAGDFIEYHRLRTRRSGRERYIDLHLVVPYDRHVDEVHRLCEVIEQEVEERFPESQVLIHVEPCDDLCAGKRNCDACEYDFGGRNWRE